MIGHTKCRGVSTEPTNSKYQRIKAQEKIGNPKSVNCFQFHKMLSSALRKYEALPYHRCWSVCKTGLLRDVEKNCFLKQRSPGDFLIHLRSSDSRKSPSSIACTGKSLPSREVNFMKTQRSSTPIPSGTEIDVSPLPSGREKAAQRGWMFQA